MSDKYVVKITANDAETAEKVLKVVETSVETNTSLDIATVKVERLDEQEAFLGDVGYRREVRS